MPDRPGSELKGSDEILRAELKKVYLARARLFVSKIRERGRGVAELIDFLSHEKSPHFDPDSLGVTQSAIRKLNAAGVPPHQVFCHPDILAKKPKVIDYYRTLAPLSRKGLTQIIEGLTGEARINAQCDLINSIVSAILDEMPKIDLELARAVIPAEIGTEIQGTWVNIIGRGAAARVQKLIVGYARDREFIEDIATQQIQVRGKTKRQSVILLKNGWTIIFADEPDVAIRDKKEVLRIAIEIKGSMDKAGAQTRYGEAKKSFSKAIKEHAQCETIYLASCFTKAVVEQIEADAQVRNRFNLIDIMEDDAERKKFLDELFVHLIRIPRA